jgi:hypothetical protein
MGSSTFRSKSPVDCFAWQYAFYTHLLYRKAPATAAHLFDVTQAVHAVRGHVDPIRAAHETLQSWPFEVTDSG